ETLQHLVAPRRHAVVHPRQQALQRQVLEVADRQAQGRGAGADGGVAQLPRAAVLDLVDRLPAEVGDAREILLIPAAFIDEARDLEGEVGGGVDWLAVHTSRYYVLPAPVNKVRCGRNPRMHPWRDKTVLITGASSGIG